MCASQPAARVSMLRVSVSAEPEPIRMQRARSIDVSPPAAHLPQVARVLLQSDPFQSNDPLLFMPSVDDSPILNGSHVRFLIDNEVSMDKQYLTSLYWALTMVMKSPWLPPSRANEQIFASIILVLGAMLFAAFIGNFTTAIASYDKHNAIRHDSINTLHHFFNTRPHMSKETRQRAYRYADAYFKQTIGGVAERAVVASLPDHLQPTVLLELHMELIKACSWLQDTSFGCCCDFLVALHPEVLLRGDTLIKAGVTTNNFYILVDGELQLTFPPEGAKLSKLSSLLGVGNVNQIHKATGAQRTSQRIPQGRVEKMGSLVGWGPPHGEARPLAYNAIAFRDTHLLSITRGKLAKVLDAHPMEATIFKRASDHAARLISPVKRGKDANDVDAAADAIHAERRVSANEIIRQSEGPMGSRQSQIDARKSRAAPASEESAREALNAAKDSGWLRNAAAASADASSFSNGSTSALSSMNSDDKMSALFDEVQELKRAVAQQSEGLTRMAAALHSLSQGGAQPRLNA
jgi:CRP-like cAMP-binding protein